MKRHMWVMVISFAMLLPIHAEAGFETTPAGTV